MQCFDIPSVPLRPSVISNPKARQKYVVAAFNNLVVAGVVKRIKIAATLFCPHHVPINVPASSFAKKNACDMFLPQPFVASHVVNLRTYPTPFPETPGPPPSTH